jgi:hypothetical protein
MRVSLDSGADGVLGFLAWMDAFASFISHDIR